MPIVLYQFPAFAEAEGLHELASLVGLSNRDITTVRARNRSLYQNEVVLCVYPHQVEVPDGCLSIAVLAGHPHPFIGTTGVSTHPDRTDCPVNLLDTVAGSLALKVVSLHDTRETATFAGPDNVDCLKLLDCLDSQYLTNFATVTGIFLAKLANEPLWLTVRLGEWLDACRLPLLLILATELNDLASLATSRTPSIPLIRWTGLVFNRQLIVKTDLHGIIAVAIDGSHLQDRTRTGFDHSYGNDFAILTVNLRHSDFSTKEANRHDFEHPRQSPPERRCHNDFPENQTAHLGPSLS